MPEGLSRSFGGKIERISDCQVYLVFWKAIPMNHRKLDQFVNGKLAIETLYKIGWCFFKMRSKYSNTFRRLQIKAIFNNYWLRVSKIWWFVSGKQINSLQKTRQIIDFQDTNKSPYFVITELDNYFIIQSPNGNLLSSFHKDTWFFNIYVN